MSATSATHAAPTLSAVVGLSGIIALSAVMWRRRVEEARENSRLRAERAAREARFQALVQHSSDVITVVDADGVIRYVSPAVTQVLGQTPE